MILKSGSVSAIIGAIVLMVATMLHPMGADPGDPIAAFAEYAADKLWVASHLGGFLGVGLIFVFVGLYAWSRSLKGDATEWFANLGLFITLVALVLAAVLRVGRSARPRGCPPARQPKRRASHVR